MPLDRTWLLAVARHERDALGRTVQYAPPERWEADSPAEGWRAKDVLAHLASTEVAAAQTIAGEDRLEFEEFMKESGGRHFTVEGFHGMNAWAVEKRRDATPISLAMEWGRAADLLLARAGKLTDEQWSDTVPWPVEPLRQSYFVQSRVCEWWVHGEDIRASVGLMSRRIHDPIHCVNDLSIRTIPYALQAEGVDGVSGKVVHVELDAAGGGEWTRGLGPRDRPEEGRVADVYIEGRGHSFALVAAHRADPDELLYEGLLQLGGDQELGRTILQHIRYFA